jgi:hypothetical protein
MVIRAMNIPRDSNISLDKSLRYALRTDGFRPMLFNHLFEMGRFASSVQELVCSLRVYSSENNGVDDVLIRKEIEGMRKKGLIDVVERPTLNHTYPTYRLKQDVRDLLEDSYKERNGLHYDTQNKKEN